MATLEQRIRDFILGVGTDVKQIRTWITGSSSGNLASLQTSDKTSLVNAINELKTATTVVADGTETTKGVVELATLSEMATGTDANRVATVAGVRQERLALRSEILGGAGAMADTLQELYTLVQSAEETDQINALVAVVEGKANKADLGNTDYDFVAAYNAAKV